MGIQSSFSGKSTIPRREIRVPMEVGVQIYGHEKLPGVEMTFTQDVSSNGARVRSVRRWRPDDKVWVITITGAFRALARVAYCQRQRGNGFAIGLEFIEPAGNWVIATPNSQFERQLQ